MDSSLQSSPGGNLEHKDFFRKPSTDTATRNYRKRSPGDHLPSSDGDPEHDNSYSQKHAKQDSTGRDYLDRKKDDEKELRKDLDQSRYGKSGDSHRYNEKNALRSYHGHEKFSHGDRQSREASDQIKSRDKDKYSRDRYESSGHRSKDREKETFSDQKFRDKISPRPESGRGREDRGEKMDHQRSSRNHRSGWEIEESITADRAKSKDRAKGHYGTSDSRERENQKSMKERNVDGSYVFREKGQPGRVGKSLDDKSVAEGDQKSPSKKSLFSSVGGPDFVKGSSDVGKQQSLEDNGKAHSAQVHGANDLNAAKFAAMRAAELVNQNLGGGTVFMSAEQKKKLLWGNKKSSVATEEHLQSARQWDVSSIGDPERQEKFNKLMGVKGGSAVSKEGSSIVQAEKHKELQIDLEKQYTAGLRRRDGRTVGLGL